MMIFQRFATRLSIIVFLFPLVIFAPKNVFAYDSSTGGTLPITSSDLQQSYSSFIEETYIRKYLSSFGYDPNLVVDILNYLRTNSYFQKTKAQKLAFLQSAFRNRKVYFWKAMPRVIKAENQNQWNVATSKNIDWYATSCMSSMVRNNAKAASVFFMQAYCGISGGQSSDTSNPNFTDKSNWSSSQLDTLYQTYWPDMANNRYRPGFIVQEVNNLKAIAAILWKSAYISGGKGLGATCDQLNDPGLISDDGSLLLLFSPLAKLFSVSNVARATLPTADVGALGNLNAAEISKLANEARDHWGIAPGLFDDAALAEEWLSQRSIDALNSKYPGIVNRWKPSGFSESEIVARDPEQYKLWMDSTTGRLYGIDHVDAKNFYQKHITFSSGNFNKETNYMLAPATKEGNLIVNARWLDSESVAATTRAYSHEWIHYRRLLSGGSSDLPALTSATDKIALEAAGWGNINPFDEGITEYLAQYHAGKFTNLASYSRVGNQMAYQPFVEVINRMVKRIMIARGCSYDEAVRLLDQAWIGNKDPVLFFYKLFHYGKDTKSGLGFISDITSAMSKGNYAELRKMFLIPIVRGQL